MRLISVAAFIAALLNLAMAHAAFSATTNSFSITGSGYYHYEAGADLYTGILQNTSPRSPALVDIFTDPNAPITIINDLPGSNVTADYSLSAFLSIDGATIGTGPLDLGTTTLATLFSDPTTSAAISVLNGVPLSGNGFLPIGGGLGLSYSYDATAPIFSGYSELNFFVNLSDDGYGQLPSLFGPTSTSGTFDIGIALSATNVQAVPLPAGLPLMAGAFGLMGVAARRRNKLA